MLSSKYLIRRCVGGTSILDREITRSGNHIVDVADGVGLISELHVFRVSQITPYSAANFMKTE